MEALLTNYVQKSMSDYMRRNATFLCERLCAEFPSEANLQLLARCYLNNNQAYSAYHILKGMKMAESRYLFAVASLEMNLTSEAEAALLYVEDLSPKVPSSAGVQYLLGIIYRSTNRIKSSVEYFRKALSIDPLFWAAYEELCILGEAEEATVYFGDAAVHHVQEHYQGNASSYQQKDAKDQSLESSQTLGLEDLNFCHLRQLDRENIKNASKNNRKGPLSAGAAGEITNSFVNISAFETPPELTQIRGSLFFDSGRRRSARLAAASSRQCMTSSKGSESEAYNLLASIKSNSKSSSSTACKAQAENHEEGKSQETYDDAVSEFIATCSTLTLSADVESAENVLANTKRSSFISNSPALKSGISDTITLLRVLGEGYRHFCSFRCQNGLDVFQKLNSRQYNTGWVLSQVGKAYFELLDYLNADYAFTLARQISPYYLEGMDVYSTVLYHLKEGMKLKYLAEELKSVDRYAPESWCAMGNCYSLEKDHETALKSFQRAVQLNSRFAYAHTLCGHEHVILEDYEDGIESYHKALLIDARHYKAWYGLGMIYLRQDKFELAEQHFRQAYQINPYSSVIMYYLGSTLDSLKRSEEALEMMEKSIISDKKNPLPKYNKAKLLVNSAKLNEALEILEDLKEYNPSESSIHMLMGEIYKQHKKYDSAILHFGIALDLKPPTFDVAKIKVAMEKLTIPDEMEDSINL